MTARSFTESKAVLLLTGAPGVGKTTVMRKVARGLSPRVPRGFVTDEMRTEDGRRCGFRIETFDGRSAVLAHQSIHSPHHVGRYGVDVRALDRMVEATLVPRGEEVFLIDEIGKMECFSDRFVERVRALLASGLPVVATVAHRGPRLVTEVKHRPDAELWQVTVENRDAMAERILAWIAARTQAPPPSPPRPRATPPL